MRELDLFRDYENAKILSEDKYINDHPQSTVKYSALRESDVEGIPIVVRRDSKGDLDISFISDSHVLAIGATRSGKTTGYVIPTLNVLLNKKDPPSIVISDPKQELFLSSAEKFKERGYRVIHLGFTDYRYSDCWNPLTKYYRLYQKSLQIENEIKPHFDPKSRKYGYELHGEVYYSTDELTRAVAEAKDEYIDLVDKGIMSIASGIISTENTKDPFWEDSARDLLRAILYGMLEDSVTGKINENTFSFDTVLRIFDTFTDSDSDYDRGYFKFRDHEKSMAYQLANKCIIEQATTTRRCISSSFAAKMSKFRDTSVRRITCTNTFEMSSLDEQPTAIFVSYKDEESLHYEIISMFLTNLYTELISIAREKGTRLTRPFYFLLDEFGNLPRFHDFDKVISACAGRNIWFLLILQSYAQLNHVYGSETAEIIKDNLNTHIFFGTNNAETKRQFSVECGLKTVISPTSALNGDGETIERYEKDTVPLVPVSTLNSITPCRCIVTQMREDVLWSRIERSYMCPEFAPLPTDKELSRSKVRFSDPKYIFEMKIDKSKPKKQPKEAHFSKIFHIASNIEEYLGYDSQYSSHRK